MTDGQFYAHEWLSRVWDEDIELEILVARREQILSSLSGIGKYDADFIPAQTGENSVESKHIEYSVLSERIDKMFEHISYENSRTLETINQVDDTTLRGMLIARYLRRLPWSEVGQLYNYSKSQTYEKYRIEALEAVYPFIPKEPIP